MQDKIRIASDACVLLGADPIQSFEEDTTEALAVRTMYDNIYESALNYRMWSFAKTSVTPVQIDKVSEYGYTFVYRVPVDVLRVITINEAQLPYKLVMRREIHTNEPVKTLSALLKINEPELPGDFVLALKFMLAGSIAPIITGDVTQAAMFEQKGMQALHVAGDNDAVQAPLTYLKTSPLLNAFHG